MGRIHILNENISNKIAAGEVVERPASVVKELVENSIDAGASSITVEIDGGGISYIRVTDDGSGMDAEDAKVSFIRHATSKITSEEDLNNINTLGFRGEALASIASVSQVEMLTKIQHNTFGIKIVLEGGEVKFIDSAGCPNGTTIIIKNLFYNTPARLKFLKKESREAAVISEIMYKLAMSKPSVSFKFINNKKAVFNTPGDGNLKNSILVLYGKDLFDSLISVSYTGNILSISGFIGKPDAARSNRNFETFFINNRHVKNRMLSTAVDNAYKTFLPVNKFAFCILFISICPDLVDVNVHPTKAEVRFQDEREIFSALFNTVRSGLAGEILIPNFEPQEEMTVMHEQQQLFNKEINSDSILKDPFVKPYSVNDVMMSSTETGYSDNNEQVKEYETIRDIKVENDQINYCSDIRNLLPPLVVIGQCEYTYILAQGPGALYIIDQHAAHERIMYEKLKKSFENGKIHSQQLIVPILVELTPKEMSLVKDTSNIIVKLGFDFEYFGNNSIMLRSVPMYFGQPQLKKLFVEIIDLIDDNQLSGKNVIDNMLYTMACKGAVKANEKLSIEEMDGLISELRQTLSPYTCPHGRPTIIKLTKNELEKKFKRT